MILALIILIPLLFASLLMFFKSSPKNLDPKKVKIYNSSTILIAILLSIIYALKIRSDMIDGSDAAWWPVIAFTFSPVVIIATILISGILRNLVIFK